MITFKDFLGEAIKLKGFGDSNQTLLNFIDDISNIHPAVRIKAAPMNGAVHISDMQSSEPGAGTDALKKITDHADRRGVPLTLFPHAYQDPGQQSKLEGWYQRFGFRPDTNRPDMFRRTPVFYEEDSSQREQSLSLGVKKLRRGSSRGYIQYSEPVAVHIDGHPVDMNVGVKRAIHSSKIDRYLDYKKYKSKGITMGHLQNKAEASPENDRYRVLHRTDDNKFVTNTSGIFPPLLNHDERHQWLEVGHVADATAQDWSELTKTKTHPNGIRHTDFYDALHHAVHGTEKEYKPATDEKRKRQLESIANHPLVQSFINYHRDTKGSIEDFAGRSNLGVWTHPRTGTRHIVARDIGWTSEIEAARDKARRNRFY